MKFISIFILSMLLSLNAWSASTTNFSEETTTTITDNDFKHLRELLNSTEGESYAFNVVMASIGRKKSYLQPLLKSYMDLALALALVDEEASHAGTTGLIKLCVVMNPVYSREGSSPPEEAFFLAIFERCMDNIKSYGGGVDPDGNGTTLIVTLNKTPKLLQVLEVRDRVIAYHEYPALVPVHAVFYGGSISKEIYDYLVSMIGVKTVSFVASDKASRIRLHYDDGRNVEQKFSFNLSIRYK